MGERTPASTRESLLARLRRDPGDQATWAEFVDLYGPVIYSWCRRWRLQEADARDVTQDVLLRMAAKLPQFSYDRAGSFRGWLKTLTHHAWYHFVKGDKPAGRGSGDSRIQELLESVAARDDLVSRLEEAFDGELLGLAVARVRQRVSPQTWEAYQLTAVEGLTGAQAAARIPMPVSRVYVARQRCQKMLQQEIQRMEASTVTRSPGDRLTR